MSEPVVLYAELGGVAIVTNFEPSARSVDGIQLFSATLKVTGALTRAAFVEPV